MSKLKLKRRRPYNPIKGTIYLPPDVADLAHIQWVVPPSAEALRAKYDELTRKMNEEVAARAVAIALLIAAENVSELPR